MVCTFIGHRDAPWNLREKLESVITDLIVNKKVDLFYMGNHGNFDRMAYQVVRKLKAMYTHIEYYMVIAYLSPTMAEAGENTLFPQDLEFVHPRNAITARNKWMIDNSEILVSYVVCDFGGAAKIKRMAEKRGKTVINLK